MVVMMTTSWYDSLVDFVEIFAEQNRMLKIDTKLMISVLKVMVDHLDQFRRT
jgi:hypothetical protein